jgi:hypothetical protein
MFKKLTISKMLAIFVLGLFISLPYANAQYCAGGPTSAFDSNVTNVTLTGENLDISHIGCPGVTGLEDLTAMVADVMPGSTYEVSVTWGTCGGTYAGAGSVWIDWNGDEVFADTEVIGTWIGSPTATMDYTFTVPDDAVTGMTRMRVMQREGGSLPLDPCGTYSWGSNMDFGIEVVAAGGPGSESATYMLGDIPTDYNQPSTCPETMTITIPEGDNVIITGVDVSYTMTAENVAYMSEQRSRISILNPGGIAEPAYASGVGTGGTYAYERLGLNIGEGVVGGGDIIVQMDAYRTWGNTAPNDGCGTWYNRVDDGTWTVTIHYDIATEGIVAGVVKDAATEEPIVGAHVMVSGQELTTVAGGAYEFTLSGGEHTIMVHKSGYMTLEQVIEILPNETLMLDLMLMESANVPGPVLAELNAAATAVNLTWGLPQGQYEIIYDDGVADNVTAWGLSGNLNALRFTPAGYPAKVVAGSVNIYDGTYPPAGNALVPFQMAVYDATGPAGYPGEELGVVDVTPGDYGWVNFDLSELDITINSGDFYLVMIQGGNFPNCAPIAIDETNPAMRSYSRFVTGGAPWTPAGFNDFMMRAIVEGPGGPNMLAYGDGQLVESGWASKGAMSLYEPQRAIAEVGMGVYKPVAGTGILDRDAIGYHVYRMVEGNEGDEALWTLVGNPTATAIVDNTWPTLDDGGYRWAVKARYPLDNFSDPVFSNVLGKNWASDVTINISLSDPEASPAGAEVELANNAFPQYTYTAVAGADGVISFDDVSKGQYTLTIYLFGYDPYTSQENIMTNTYTKNVTLMETTNPPSNLVVNPINLMATWNQPSSFTEFHIDFNSGIPSDWTVVNGGVCNATWQGVPNYGGSSTLDGSPFALVDSDAAGSGCGLMDEQLITPPVNTLGLPTVILEFDQYYRALGDNADVDVWNGSAWVTVLSQTATSGAWGAPNSRAIDITAHSNAELKVRFHYYNANWAWYWAIDNVKISDGTRSDRGVIGYYVYLDDVLAGFTEETFFQYQPEYIEYGQTYTAGVRAVYESGFSPKIDYVFTSMFLYPPCDLEGEDAGHAVDLTWSAPGLCDPFGGGGGGGGGAVGDFFEGFESGTLPAGWLSVDVDGDGYKWDNSALEFDVFDAHSGLYCMTSASFRNDVGPLTPNNWLITPAIQVTATSELKFWVDAQDPAWSQEQYYVRISTTGTAIGDFTEEIHSAISPANWTEVVLSLSQFAGESIHIAFVHANVTDMFFIKIDDVTVTDTETRAAQTASVAAGNSQSAAFKTEGMTQAEIEAGMEVYASQVSTPSLLLASMDPNHVPMPIKGTNRANTNTRSDIGYGWNAFAGASGVLEGSVSVAIPAGTITSIQAVPSATLWMAGGDWANGVWYTVSYSAANNSGFYSVDHTTGNYTLIGNTGFGMTGLAYDVTTQTMYASGFDGVNTSNLYTINMATGVATLVGQITDGIVIAIAADAGGNMFATHLNTDALWSINPATGTGTQVGPLGVTINFAQDIGFDRDNNILYGTLYTTSGGFYTINVATGQASFINNFIAEICALGIPYTAGGGGGGPIETAGFRIYRDGAMIAEVDGETFSFTDDDGDYLLAGTYNYTVTALYEYGDNIVESQHEGPATVVVAPGFGFVNGIVFDAVTFQPVADVTITAGQFTTTTQANGSYSLIAHEGVYDIHFDKIGYALHVEEDFEIVWQETKTLNVELTPQDPNFPFEETWASGSFATQGWTFVPAQGNWRISTTAGNPAPSAEFYWSPSVTNYSNALTSVEIDARAATQNVTLEYAIFLDNFSATSAEKITVEIWNGEEWVFVAEYKNDSDIPWTTHQHDVTAHAAGKMTRVRFVANGANTFDINWWYLDNIKLHEVLPPAISVTPSDLFQALTVGTTATQELTVNNIGDGQLNFTTQVEYLDKGNVTIYPVPAGEKVVVSDMDLSTAPFHVPGGAPEAPARNEVILNYDGPNNDAIGLTAGGTFNVAARFPSSMVGQYAGYVLESVDVYINDVPSGANLKIWGAGTGTAPGAILHQQTFTSTASSWITVTLTNPVVLDGTDIWVGYEVTHGASQFPAGCDAGPANPNGDWISTDGVTWEHLAGFGLNYNWNIRAKLNAGEGLWLTISPNSGNVAPGGSQTLTAEFDATGLEIREYTANININSNDPDNPTVVVPVLLDVLIGINEVEREAVMVYPVPANDILNVVTSQGIRNVRMFSYTGQVVFETSISGESTLNIDVKTFNNGAYILQFITEDGLTFNKRILISR